MTTQQIAQRLAELCKQGEFETAQKELFTEDTTSIEPFASQGFEKEIKGVSAIVEKGHKFQSMVETVHGIKVSEPLVSGNSIAFTLDMDMTMTGQGRSNMAEICVYEVKDGKVASERFFM
jgi:hypothetical protein